MSARRIVCIVAVLLLVTPLMAQETGWVLRGRLINISPNDSSTTIGDTGTGAAVDSAMTLEVDLTYKFNDRWAVEVIAATAKHDLKTESGDLAGADAGEVTHLPPTVTLQYHFPVEGAFHPYVGAGLNYTIFYDYEISSDLRGLGLSDLDFENSFGLAGQLGFDYDINDRWLFNVDVKYIKISTDVDLQLAVGGVLDTITVDIDPWVLGVGIGYRF